MHHVTAVTRLPVAGGKTLAQFAARIPLAALLAGRPA